MFDRRSRPGPTEKQRAKHAGATIRRIWRYLHRQRAGLVTVVFLTLIATAASLAGPYLLGRAIDAHIVPRQFDGLLGLCGVLLSVYAVGSLTAWIQAYVMSGVSQRTVWDIRENLFRHLQKLPLRYFDRTPHGELMSRTTNDVENISVTLNQSFIQIVASALTLIGSFVMMLTLNVWLTLVTLVTAPLVLFVAKTIAKRTKGYFKRQQQHLGELNGFIEETVSGQKAIKILHREERAIAEFERINAELKRAGMKAQVFSGTIGPAMNMMGHLSFILIAAAGGWMAIHGMTKVGVIVAFLTYSRQFTWPLNDLANQYNAIQAAVAGAERVFDVMDMETEYADEEPRRVAGRAMALSAPDGKADRWVSDGHKSVQPVPAGGRVVFGDVTFGYEAGRPTLRGIDFAAEPGQVVALVGPTGAGKTTIINLLTRFYDVDEGVITIDGEDIRSLPKDALRSRLGIVLQDAYLFSDTIRENIRYGRLDATDEEIAEAARLANADGFIRKLPLGYDTPMTSSGGNLSHGQRQLVTIARAILANPSILVLDEATSSVDTRTEMHIQEAMNTLMQGRTSFVIAHRLNTVRGADLILVIDNGGIVERGTHEQLLARDGFYARLYNSQFQRAV
ncbi:ABC transporter ATP-binding protein [Cohnella sp. REN36]|uniref:ABC transporter ATP-binding protein n=1 Tax=Cohnella sp. REN36 TaxID=2887347 RepID=UPI001D13AED7|nr:ABC transporter ATP-binding protein [Cohnella sp. REN36]MCC3375103.1 ABC transporter ATP-binding protein/permease [Cohnella sp. REN36]